MEPLSKECLCHSCTNVNTSNKEETYTGSEQRSQSSAARSLLGTMDTLRVGSMLEGDLGSGLTPPPHQLDQDREDLMWSHNPVEHHMFGLCYKSPNKHLKNSIDINVLTDIEIPKI